MKGVTVTCQINYVRIYNKTRISEEFIYKLQAIISFSVWNLTPIITGMETILCSASISEITPIIFKWWSLRDISFVYSCCTEYLYSGFGLRRITEYIHILCQYWSNFRIVILVSYLIDKHKIIMKLTNILLGSESPDIMLRLIE